MKTTFWKHQFEALLFWPLMIGIGIVFIILGIILTTKQMATYWPITLIGIIVLLPSSYMLFFHKRTLTKVVFYEEGIELRRFKTTSMFLSWSDIIDVKPIIRSRGLCWLSFVASNKTIELELTQKMYDTIMAICPIPNIKVQINEIECFKYLHKTNN